VSCSPEHAAPDYNGHWDVRDIFDICSTAQQRGAEDYRPPVPADIDRVLLQPGYQGQATHSEA
jgi:hypothetical protein